MRRRTQYRSRRGRREYRYVDSRPGRPLRWAMIALLILAGLIVIASLI